MDKQREKFVAELNRLKEAVNITKSAYQKKDYLKAIRRMEIELKEYDAFQKEYKKKLNRS